MIRFRYRLLRFKFWGKVKLADYLKGVKTLDQAEAILSTLLGGVVTIERDLYLHNMPSAQTIRFSCMTNQPLYTLNIGERNEILKSKFSDSEEVLDLTRTGLYFFAKYTDIMGENNQLYDKIHKVVKNDDDLAFYQLESIRNFRENNPAYKTYQEQIEALFIAKDMYLEEIERDYEDKIEEIEKDYGDKIEVLDELLSKTVNSHKLTLENILDYEKNSEDIKKLEQELLSLGYTIPFTIYDAKERL